MEKSKKIAAAVSGVFAYIRAEEDALSGMIPTEPLTVMPPVSIAPVSAKCWGMSGRQDIMHYRNLMQLRTFQGAGRR
jgi:hypothetical protein